MNVLWLLAFVAMEGVTYVAHRWVMHGFAWVLHRSHHQRLASRFEANDIFPVVFAALTLMVMALANGWQPLWSVGLGITLYGIAYLFVHDAYIHERIPLPRKMFGFLKPWRRAHRIHHLYGGEPYGMLLPVVPRRLRVRAMQTERDPLAS